MTEEEFLEHCEENNGFCTKCKDVTNFGGVEPDAENYECEECAQPSVMGMEQALLCREIDGFEE